MAAGRAEQRKSVLGLSWVSLAAQGMVLQMEMFWNRDHLLMIDLLCYALELC